VGTDGGCSSARCGAACGPFLPQSLVVDRKSGVLPFSVRRPSKAVAWPFGNRSPGGTVNRKKRRCARVGTPPPAPRCSTQVALSAARGALIVLCVGKDLRSAKTPVRRACEPAGGHIHPETLRGNQVPSDRLGRPSYGRRLTTELVVNIDPPIPATLPNRGFGSLAARPWRPCRARGG